MNAERGRPRSQIRLQEQRRVLLPEARERGQWGREGPSAFGGHSPPGAWALGACVSMLPLY